VVERCARLGYTVRVLSADDHRAVGFAVELGPTERAPHTLDSATGHRVIARPAAAGDAWVRGDRVGRYTLQAAIGHGGMGAVWRAYDPELGRAVALKRVRAGASDGDRARLVREARAAARLQHPNIVAVYEVGDTGGEPFLAMELVEGDTLDSWVRSPALPARGQRAILDALVQAGRGLAAAHACGLVHRDFKPHNVLVDHAGRVRVADFGLARAMGVATGAPLVPTSEQLEPLTQTGRLSGTPAYVAPELVAGAPPDARSDQYAFAVTAFEAIYGRHPFPGATVQAKWLAMADGRIAWPRAGRARTRLARAIARGLAVDPAARWPSVDAMVAELSRAPRRPVVAVAAALAAAAIAAILVGAVRPAPAASIDDCETGAGLVDAVWSPTARAALQDAGATELTPAVRLVDDWAEAWRLGRRAACHVAAPLRDARVACLDRSLGTLRAQLAAWPTAGAGTRIDPVAAFANLPRPEDCTSHAPPAAKPQPALEDRIAKLRALAVTGQARAAGPQIDALVADARAADEPGVLARALVVAAWVERLLGDRDRARAHDAEAATAAAHAADDPTTLQALLNESVISVDQGRPADALGLCDAAAALVARVGLDREDRVLMSRGEALAALGRAPEAITAFEQTIARLEPRAAGDRAARLQLTTALGGLASAYEQQKRTADARAALVRALAIDEAERGADDPEIANTLHDLAIKELELGNHGDGVAHLERARAMLARAFGDASEQVAICDLTLGDEAEATGRCRDALPLYDRARAGIGFDASVEAAIEIGRGKCAEDAADHRGAAVHFEAALAVYARLGTTGDDVAEVDVSLAAALAALRRDADARDRIDQALAELDRAGVSPQGRVGAWRVLADLEHRAGRRGHAIELERAVVAAIPADAPPDARALRGDAEAQIAAWSAK
jgi:tetratricopeptide (TPR) repeat protein